VFSRIVACCQHRPAVFALGLMLFLAYTGWSRGDNYIRVCQMEHTKSDIRLLVWTLIADVQVVFAGGRGT